MNTAIALPGNSDRTFLTHLLARGLEDDRYVVERFQALADGDIRRMPGEEPAKNGRRKAKRATVAPRRVAQHQPERLPAVGPPHRPCRRASSVSTHWSPRPGRPMASKDSCASAQAGRWAEARPLRTSPRRRAPPVRPRHRAVSTPWASARRDPPLTTSRRPVSAQRRTRPRLYGRPCWPTVARRPATRHPDPQPRTAPVYDRAVRGETMNKTELASSVATRTSITRATADSAVAAVFAPIAEALARGEKVSIAGFSTFATRSRPARQGRNPATGESIAIAASTAPSFKAGKTLRDAANRQSG